MNKLLTEIYKEEILPEENFSDSVLKKLRQRQSQREARKKIILRLTYSFSILIIAMFTVLFFFQLKNKNGEKEILLSYQSDTAKEVLVMGDFNNWEKEKLKYKDGTWSITIKVKPQVYNYVFLVDDIIVLDHKAAKIKDSFGSQNSVLVVLK